MNIARGVSTVTANVIASTGIEVQPGIGALGPKKFIPKKPTTKEIGMKSVVITVRVFIMSFMRLLITER